MKRSVVLALILMLLVFISTAWAGEENNAVFTIGKSFYLLNGNTVAMDVAPYIKEGRTFLPLRFAANSVGVTDENIIWDPGSRKIVIIRDNRVVQLAVGSRVLVINGTVVMMDVVPEEVSGRVMLPIRWLASSLGVSIKWDPVSQSVVVGTFDGPGEKKPLPADNEQERKLEEHAAGYKAIAKEYKWRDMEGNEWTWRVPIPEEMYQYYRNQPRIHERVLEEYLEQVNNLKRQIEELQRYMDYWYQQCRILPEDTYYEAWQKYQMYMAAYNKAQRELIQILTEYQKLQLLYKETEYRQMLNGYVPYVTEEENYELVKILAGMLAEKAPQNPKERIEFAAAFVQGSNTLSQ